MRSGSCNRNNGMTDEARNTFLNEHNKLRSLVAKGMAENPLGSNGYAPKAARMLKMVYDCTVEQTALNHARQCQFKHSTSSGNGENLWMMTPTKDNLTAMAILRDLFFEASQSWFSELKKSGVPPDNRLTMELWNRPNKVVGHYTQVSTSFTVRAFYSRLGCDLIEDGMGGFVQTWLWDCVMPADDTRCMSVCTSVSSTFSIFLVVCTKTELKYSSGNMIGSLIYNVGEPCKTDSNCQCNGCTCSRNEALCIKPA
ncbi:unnamed protein product [Angiostrongylus costaricensis]|uniref:SCP domain-containing protein n=1 Tax=Angiostrongylus costaricensis TaxID=334426 RepID=A0A0R3PYY9_ANGCS|nr:unnamed protein product [Angiostrongylus costaricensis]